MIKKSALVALVLVFSGMSLAAETPISTIGAFKELDGKVRRCFSATVGTPSYTLKDLRVQNVTNEGFRLSFTKQNLKCAPIGNDFRWVETTEDFNTEHVVDEYGRVVTIFIENSEVLAVTDDLKVISAAKSIAGAGLQNVAIDVRNVDVIGEQGQDAFNKSGQASISLNVFTRGLVTYTDGNGQKNIIGLKTGGSFRITVNLHKFADGNIVPTLN